MEEQSDMADRWVDCYNLTFKVHIFTFPQNCFQINSLFKGQMIFWGEDLLIVLYIDVSLSGQPCWNVLLASC